jgi:hypothetical protein
MTNTKAGKELSPVQQMQAALEEFREEVRLLAGMKLKGAAALRKLLPSLDRLNKLGLTQDVLVEEMGKAGMEMTLGYFKTAVYRLRKADQQQE